MHFLHSDGPLVILEEHWQLLIKISVRVKLRLCSWLTILVKRLAPLRLRIIFFQGTPARKAAPWLTEWQTGCRLTKSETHLNGSMHCEGKTKHKIVKTFVVRAPAEKPAGSRCQTHFHLDKTTRQRQHCKVRYENIVPPQSLENLFILWAYDNYTILKISNLRNWK